MAIRVCPECNAQTDEHLCPRCGGRTLLERRPEEASDPLPGRVLEQRYRIDSLIGRGGMGAVYRGLQLATQQIVAVKVIRAEHSQNPEAARRFHREARAASLLTHPHTIRVFDFGQSDDGDLYLVLEFLRGRTLARLLRDEARLTEARTSKIAAEVAQSLAEAHAAGLAHRDLKPENIMLVDAVGDHEFVKVLDFGIAKVLTANSNDSGVTRDGLVIGTPDYMAPEQARGGRGVTPAVDVYALGIIVFEALCGKRPYDGESAVEILMAHARDPVPELPVDCLVSQEMRALLHRMLAKEPGDRPTAGDLVGTFERLKVAVVSPGSTGTWGRIRSTTSEWADTPPTPHPATQALSADDVESVEVDGGGAGVERAPPLSVDFSAREVRPRMPGAAGPGEPLTVAGLETDRPRRRSRSWWLVVAVVALLAVAGFVAWGVAGPALLAFLAGEETGATGEANLVTPGPTPGAELSPAPAVRVAEPAAATRRPASVPPVPVATPAVAPSAASTSRPATVPARDRPGTGRPDRRTPPEDRTSPPGPGTAPWGVPAPTPAAIAPTTTAATPVAAPPVPADSTAAPVPARKYRPLDDPTDDPSKAGAKYKRLDD